ncbi:hypothetical protein IGB42_02406 [Andreprevotia sp. IGB-42]|uniref:hypothetical protein n=1 Tax=Andreprevotia sp. IGB-42 TaxID=2497473 RepID=UPI0013597184|nr:hypothetical protein [Andreprevotia sp. IGB-42]KAF0813010.1 hypothetical protein IGB42_02406 [Andreprevotia sp. IGB-42]
MWKTLRAILPALLFATAMLSGCDGESDAAPASSSTSSVLKAPSSAGIGIQEAGFVAPVTGWYWNPAEGGRGFAIERQGDQIFMAAFLYEASGAATWYVSTLARNANGQYAGELNRYTGGQSLLGVYKAPAATVVASAVLAFTSGNEGTLQITPKGSNPVVISLQRFPISTPAFAASAIPFANGWYWNEAEGGRGYFIEVQGTQAFIGSFMYDSNGQPTWYVSTASVEKLAGLGGMLKQYSGGQTLTSAFRAATESPLGAGKMSFNLGSDGSGQMLLPNGASVAMKPFIFNGARNDPARTAPKCAEDETLSNGHCVKVGDGLVLTGRIMLQLGVVPQQGQTYQISYCVTAYDCTDFNVPYFVSYEDLRDPETPSILAYVDEVMQGFQDIIIRMIKAGHSPGRSIMSGVFGKAIADDISNGSRNAVAAAAADFVKRGYAAAALPAAPGTPDASDSSECTLAKQPAGTGPVIISTQNSSVPSRCYKNRNSTFGWAEAGGSAADACDAAQNPKRNADLDFFNAQRTSACYCKPDGKVNSVTMPFVCHVFFDIGK